MEKKLILLDTDIGTDIDDAVCMAYLLAQATKKDPLCDIVGITTVAGSPVERAMLASSLCNAAGRSDIPIYPGSPTPLLINQRQDTCAQAAVLDRFDHRTDFPMHRHIQFMIDTIRANPGQITLLAIGPMTNVALLFATDPEIPGLLKELVLMCGRFTDMYPYTGLKEWNAFIDPHATAMVYRTAAPLHRSIGLDVTKQVTMKSADVVARFNHPLLQVVLTMAEVWFRNREIITFHDPLAAATLFDPTLCTYHKGNVEIELLSDQAKGITYWNRDEANGRHEVAITVNKERFFENFFGAFDA